MDEETANNAMRLGVLITALSLAKTAKELGPEWECVVEYCKKVIDETIPEDKP